MSHEKKPRTAKSTASLFAVWALSLSIFATGCNAEKNCYYEGLLQVDKKFPASSTGKGLKGFYGTKFVAVKIDREGWDGTIRVEDPKSGEPVMETITLLSLFKETLYPGDIGKIQINMPSLKDHFELKRKGRCFDGNSLSGAYKATACLKHYQDIEIDITETNQATGKDQSVYHLSAAPFSKPTLPPPSQGPMTLKQAIDIALATNPASARELQNKFQAKNQALASALGMTPSANIGTAINILSNGALSLSVTLLPSAAWLLSFPLPIGSI